MMDVQSSTHAFEASFDDSMFTTIQQPSSRDTVGGNHGQGGSLGRDRDGRPARARITMLPVSSYAAQERPCPRQEAPKMASTRPQRRASLGSAAPRSSAGDSFDAMPTQRTMGGATRTIDTIRQSFETTLATNLEYGFTTILPSTCTSSNPSNRAGPMRRRASLNGGTSELHERAMTPPFGSSSSLHRSRKTVAVDEGGLSGVFDAFDGPTALRTKGDGLSSRKPSSRGGNGVAPSRISRHSAGMPGIRLSDPLSRSAHTIAVFAEAWKTPSGDRAEGMSPAAQSLRRSVGGEQLSSSSLHASHHSRAGPARRRASMSTATSTNLSGSDSRKAPNADGYGMAQSSAHPPSFHRSTSQPLPSSSQHKGQVMRRRTSLTGGSGDPSGTYQEGPPPPSSSPRRTSGPRRIQRRTSIGNRYGAPQVPVDVRPESPSFAEEEDNSDPEVNAPVEMAPPGPAPLAGRTKRSAGRVASRRRRLANATSASNAPAATPSKPSEGEEQSVVSHSTADTQSSSSDHP